MGANYYAKSESKGEEKAVTTQIGLMLFQLPAYKAPRSLPTRVHMVGWWAEVIGIRYSLFSQVANNVLEFHDYCFPDYLYILPLIYIFLKN